MSCLVNGNQRVYRSGAAQCRDVGILSWFCGPRQGASSMALSLPQALHLWLETSGKLRTVEGREKLTCDLNASKEQSNAIAVIAALIAALRFDG
mmetsp:Transcript_1310/g.2760  ORF Transcript_1310/g.2760 Transcript_1310/m.2760 type:complete len:94 (+) Transcript_1310:371-652(+)